MAERVSDRDLDAIEAQLGRRPRNVEAIAHRCDCGDPDVVTTSPKLEDGTPFPTLYYATCPRLTAAISTLEGSGIMSEMTTRLATDAQLAGAYHAAHDDYLATRDALARHHGIEVPEIEGISAGGMPDRVKCLHALIAHSLAAGPGVNPIGDEALARLSPWFEGESCRPSDSTGSDKKKDFNNV